LLRIPLAICLAGGDDHARLFSGTDRPKLFIQALNNLTCAFQIDNRRSTRGGVENATIGITKGVIESDNAWHHPVSDGSPGISKTSLVARVYDNQCRFSRRKGPLGDRT